MIGSLIGYSGGYGSYANYRMSGGMPDKTAAAEKAQAGVMSDYYRENPQDKEAQEKRVKEGYEYLAAQGFSPEGLAGLPMNDYRSLMKNAIAKIPFHETRPYDEETVNISEDGWANMKKDADYAAWIAGYIKEERQVPGRFAGKGDKGSYAVHEFGATPEDYHGHTYSKILGGTSAGARTLYMAESEAGGIVTRAHAADEQPSKNYNIWNEMRRAGRRRQEELIGADLQAKSQRYSSMVMMSESI